MAWGRGQAAPKPEPRKRTKARAARRRTQWRRTIRRRIFDRDCFMCRCCLRRSAETMHEIVPRSIGGAVSMENSIALCGDGVRGCHGLCQRHEILVVPAGDDAAPNANTRLRFEAQTPAALAHLGRSYTLSSPVDVAADALQAAYATGVIKQRRSGTYHNATHRGRDVTFIKGRA